MSGPPTFEMEKVADRSLLHATLNPTRGSAWVVGVLAGGSGVLVGGSGVLVGGMLVEVQVGVGGSGVDVDVGTTTLISLGVSVG